MPTEKYIKGYEGQYSIISDGTIISHVGGKKSLRKPVRDKDGYMTIILWKNNVGKQYKIHRIVGESFITNPESKPQINHKNGIKDDNRMENIEWCTKSENERHKCRVLGFKAQNNAKNNEIFRQIFIEGRKKKVMQLTKEGILCKVYDCINDAVRLYGSSIHQSLSGKNKYAYGYEWKFLT